MSAALLWSSQYLVVIAVGLSTAVWLLSKEPKVWASRLFFTYSLLVSTWALAVFIHRTTDSLEISSLFFRIGAISLFLAKGTYLATAFTIRSQKKRYLLLPLPALMVSVAGPTL